MPKRDDQGSEGRPGQLPLPLREAGPGGAARTFRLIRGEGQPRDETLHSRDDVVRLLVGAACDMMLKRISPDRAHEIEVRVERIMRLFDRQEDDPIAVALLRRELDDLEKLYREGRGRPHQARR